MATFPAIAPIHPANKRTSPLASKLLLGDGYEVDARFGLNNVRPEWPLVWEVRQADADAIDDFLQARADAGEHFDWQSPDAATTLRWRCDEWTVEQLAFDWFRVSATFRRVFELGVIELPAAAASGEFPGDQCAVGFNPFVYNYVGYTSTIRYGPNLSLFTTQTRGRWALSTIKGIKTRTINPALDSAFSPVGFQGLWEVTGKLYHDNNASGQIQVFEVYVELNDGSTTLTTAGVTDNISPYVGQPQITATIEATFSFYDTMLGPVVATWPGYTIVDPYPGVTRLAGSP